MLRLSSFVTAGFVVFCSGFLLGQSFHLPVPQGDVNKAWMADKGNGTFKNPILHSDYSDPDAIRVGEDYFMTASSFNCAPGLPILHSRDMVNWTILTHVFTRQFPVDHFSKPQHGNGVWAPAIRYYGGMFYIFYGDPDFGIYMTKAKHPAGPWTEPHLVKAGKGWIDSCPFWDEDGNAYLVHAFAGSRSGIKSILVLHRMRPDGTALLDDGVLVFDGHKEHTTVEGPKMYKRNGYYYLFAPAGGVATGWQLVLRSRNIYGPYEAKVVMDQGKTKINGPHQGAWVDTPGGESWFFHFQDREAYGRIVHLQPMKWVADWPVIGNDPDGDGKGEPVMEFKKPLVGKAFPLAAPATSDEFDLPQLGLQWQWQANPQPEWGFPTGYLGFFRLNAVLNPSGFRNLWDLPNLLLQKIPAPAFSATVKLTFSPNTTGEKAGLVVMGADYAYIGLEKADGQLHLILSSCKAADKGSAETVHLSQPVSSNTVYFRVEVKEPAMCSFSYSTDGKTFQPVGPPFEAKPGRWIGAKIGLFCSRTLVTNDSGYADADWFRVE